MSVSDSVSVAAAAAAPACDTVSLDAVNDGCKSTLDRLRRMARNRLARKNIYLCDSDVDDIVSEAMLSVLQGCRSGGYRTPNSYSSLCFLAVRSAIHDYFKAREHERGGLADIDAQELEYHLSQPRTNDSETQLPRWMLSLVGERYQLVAFALSKGMKQCETADQLGLSYSQLKERKRKLRVILRLFDPSQDQDAPAEPLLVVGQG